jgi:hypothetical protein
MKPILTLAAVLLTLSGCYGNPGPSGSPSPHAAPISAQIIPSSPGIGMRFHVNRPAYAALFQIVPGAGVSQVYPALGTGNMDGHVYSGYTSLSTLRVVNVEQYAPVPLAAGGPRFYFLITSDRPLDIKRFGTFGYGLRRELGLQFTDFNAFETMERIAELTIPAPVDQQSWSTDFYVDWPNVLYREPVAGMALVPLRCGSYQMWVPMNRVMEADARICHPNTVQSPQQPQSPADSTGVTEPAPRSPTPPASKPEAPKAADQRTATSTIREHVRESAQLETSGSDDAAARDRPGWQRVMEARGRVRNGANDGGRASGRTAGSGSSSSVRGETTVTSATARSSGSSSSGSSGSPSASPAPSPAPASTPSAPAPSPAPRPASNGG